MVNKSQFVLLMMALILASCTAIIRDPEDEYIEATRLDSVTAAPTSIATETPKRLKVTTPSLIKVTDVPVVTTLPTVTLIPAVTLTQVSPTNVPVTSETVLVTEISNKCTSNTANQISVPNAKMNGLILYRENNKGKGVVEILKDGENFRLEAPENNLGIPNVSPDGQWIAFYTHGDSGFALWVTNMAGTITSSYILEEIPLSRFTSPKWLNNSKIIFSLENEENIFEWIIWSPETNEEHRLSLTLESAGEEVEIYETFPVLDPIFKAVVYPCYKCNGAEYRVADTQASKIMWDIDLGVHPTTAYRGLPVWSPNGEYLVLGGGRNHSENGLWVYNRDGDLIHDLILPDIESVFAADVLTWSPNNEYVAFRWLKSSELFGDDNKTLAYLAIDDGSVTDLCINFPEGWPVWSPDSDFIAIQMVDQEEQQTYLKIVDVNNGDIIDFHDGSLFYVIGWASDLGDFSE